MPGERYDDLQFLDAWEKCGRYIYSFFIMPDGRYDDFTVLDA